MEQLFVGAVVVASIALLAFRGYRKLTPTKTPTQAGCSGCSGCPGVESCAPVHGRPGEFVPKGTAPLVLLFVLCSAAPARALDTVETWDVGATDLELYVGYDGFGLNRADRQLASNLVAGFGIIERLSAYLGATLSSDELFSEGAGEIGLGLFGTGLDTDHVDLDIFLDFALGGEGFKELQIAPALELNLDLAPDRQTWGVYVLVALPIYGRPIEGLQSGAGNEIATHIEATIGTYLSLGDRHQILVDYEMAFHPMARGEEASVEVGSVGLGYNVLLHDAIELITEVRLDIPAEGQVPSVGFMAGFIATLPSARGGGEGRAEGLASESNRDQGRITPRTPARTASAASRMHESHDF